MGDEKRTHKQHLAKLREVFGRRQEIARQSGKKHDVSIAKICADAGVDKVYLHGFRLKVDSPDRAEYIAFREEVLAFQKNLGAGIEKSEDKRQLEELQKRYAALLSDCEPLQRELAYYKAQSSNDSGELDQNRERMTQLLAKVAELENTLAPPPKQGNVAGAITARIQKHVVSPDNFRTVGGRYKIGSKAQENEAWGNAYKKLEELLSRKLKMRLYILVGLPCSGKSTWAEEGTVTTDRHPVFFDATNLTSVDSHKRTTEKTDYIDQVISIDHYGKLYRALKEIDPVYAVLAQVMMQTFLRVADVCEVPLHKNNYNFYLPLWPEFERHGRDSLRYKLLTKRSKIIEIDIYGETVQAIYKDYIQPYYQDRRELFDSSYMKRTNATLEFGNIRDKAKRTLPEDILWFTKTGAPVKPYMIEEAFRKAGLNTNPHMLRHTGATHTLWNYCQFHKIEPDVRLAGMFQEILQEQLGHADLDTTRKYIRTIMKLKGRKTMPFIIPGNKEAIDKKLAKTIRTNIKDQMARFFEYRAEAVEVEKDPFCGNSL